MNTQRTLRTERAVKAARQVAPVSNWVKPSKAEISLPTPMKPTFETINRLERELQAEKAEKLVLQNQLAAIVKRNETLTQRIMAFLKDERS